MIRSFLFVPGDSERKLQKSLAANADALILDLEDSVAPQNKAEARRRVNEFIAQRKGEGPQLYVRVNDLKSGATLADLEAVLRQPVDGVVLPKCLGGTDIAQLSHYMDAMETAFHGAPRSSAIVAIATETAEAIFSAGSYRGCSPRLYGLMWGAEDLASDLGAQASRVDGAWTPVFEQARSACLLAAAAAGVHAIDTVFTDFADHAGFSTEARAARRDGFTSKAAIHPDQVKLINDAFTPSAAELDWARRVLAALDTTEGVATLDGKMIDIAHIKLARRLLGN